jgi:hypothetical protein
VLRSRVAAQHGALCGKDRVGNMNRAIELVSNRLYKWFYLVLYSILTVIYCVICGIADSMASAFISIITAIIDWISVFGFVKRKAFLYPIFWRGWFWWSLLWFFWLGQARDLIGLLTLDLRSLLALIIYGIYYGTFFLMLYAYGYVEERIWR